MDYSCPRIHALSYQTMLLFTFSIIMLFGYFGFSIIDIALLKIIHGGNTKVWSNDKRQIKSRISICDEF